MRIPKYLIYSSVLFLFLVSSVAAFNVEFGLPDSLSGFRVWDEGGGFIGNKVEKCPSFEFSVNPENGRAGAEERYLIEFTVPEKRLPRWGGFVFGFPEGFDLHSISGVVYHDQADAPDLVIRRVFVFKRLLVVLFRRGASLEPGTLGRFDIELIGNPRQSGSYEVAGVVLNGFFQVVLGPDSSDPFEIGPVSSGDIVSFDLEYDSVVTAGETFTLAVANAIDGFGQPAGGLVTVTLVEGGVSPWGWEPILNDIEVVAGYGMADQTLYQTGRAVLRAGADSFYRDISVEIEPADQGSFVLEAVSTQFPSYPLLAPSVLTALDQYGNVKTDFNAADNPVDLIIDRGELNIDRLSGEADFNGGLADLNALGLQFSGKPGRAHLYAESGSVTSNEVELIFNGLLLSFIEPPRDTFRLGDIYEADVELYNPGDLMPQYIMGGVSACFISVPSCLSLPSLAPGPGERDTLHFRFRTAGLDLPAEDVFAVGRDDEYFYAGSSFHTRSEITHDVYIRSPLLMEYVAGSLSPDTVYAPSVINRLSMEFSFPGAPDFEVGSYGFPLWADLPGSSERILLFRRIDLDYEDGIFKIVFHDVEIPDITQFYEPPLEFLPLHMRGGSVRSLSGDSTVVAPVDVFDSLYLVYPGNLEYVSGSLAPTTVFNDVESSFAWELFYGGRMSLDIDHDLSRFELLYDDIGSLSIALSDTITALLPGNNYLTTRGISVPASLIGRELVPRLILYSAEFGTNRVDTVFFGEERVLVSDKTGLVPQVRINAADLLTVNPPYVNYGQEFDILVEVENISENELDSVSLFIRSEDGSVTYTELHDLVLPALTVLDTSLSLVAPFYSAPSIIYKAVMEAPGAEILPELDNTVSITVQSPADIELEYSLLGTFNGYVDFDQTFYIAARLKNNGEAAAGPGEVSLVTGGHDFGLPDSSALMLAIDSIGEFELTAPEVSLLALLDLKITQIPLDLNTGQPAEIDIGGVMIPVRIRSSFAELIVDGIISESPLVVGGTSRDLFFLELFNNTENDINKIGLKSIVISITDNSGFPIEPERVLVAAESGFYLNDVKITTTVEDGGRLRFIFDNCILDAGVTDTLIFKTTFSEVIGLSDFQVSIDSRDIRAVFAAGPRINQTVPVRGKFADSFVIGSGFIVVRPDLEGSLAVRNNPFNPDEGPAEITYILRENTDMEIQVFTLTGEKVYTITYPAGANGGRAGQNYISWSGRNDEGKTVLNGVYIMVLNPASENDNYKLKLAVMK